MKICQLEGRRKWKKKYFFLENCPCVYWIEIHNHTYKCTNYLATYTLPGQTVEENLTWCYAASAKHFTFSLPFQKIPSSLKHQLPVWHRKGHRTARSVPEKTNFLEVFTWNWGTTNYHSHRQHVCAVIMVIQTKFKASAVVGVVINEGETIVQTILT